MATSAGKVAFTLKGTYNAETTYSILDVVSYGGGSYAAKGTTVGNLPTDTTYWQKLASAGEGGGGAKYGTSQTSGATADKVVATVYTDFELETGASVLVYFANADTAGSVTLNIDGTGAKSVKMNGSVLPSDFLANNTIYQFIYNGTDYVVVSGAEQTAERTPCDNNLSGLTADNVQGAIDELGTEKANNLALANVELTNTATAAHAVGTYFILGGQFVRTTAAIDVGDTIAIGTNVIATDVGSVLTELNSNLTQCILNRKIRDTPSSSGNIIFTPTRGYIPICAYCDSVNIRFAYLALYQKTWIVHIVDTNLSPVTTMTELYVVEAKCITIE